MHSIKIPRFFEKLLPAVKNLAIRLLYPRSKYLLGRLLLLSLLLDTIIAVILSRISCRIQIRHNSQRNEILIVKDAFKLLLIVLPLSPPNCNVCLGHNKHRETNLWIIHRYDALSYHTPDISSPPPPVIIIKHPSTYINHWFN